MSTNCKSAKAVKATIREHKDVQDILTRIREHKDVQDIPTRILEVLILWTQLEGFASLPMSKVIEAFAHVTSTSDAIMKRTLLELIVKHDELFVEDRRNFLRPLISTVLEQQELSYDFTEDFLLNGFEINMLFSSLPDLYAPQRELYTRFSQAYRDLWMEDRHQLQERLQLEAMAHGDMEAENGNGIVKFIIKKYELDSNEKEKLLNALSDGVMDLEQEKRMKRRLKFMLDEVDDDAANEAADEACDAADGRKKQRIMDKAAEVNDKMKGFLKK